MWLRILAALAFVLLACALKNYLVYLVAGTGLCPYLCPSALGGGLPDQPYLDRIFQVQFWIQERLQALADSGWNDPYKLGRLLVIAPVIEETIYRGPLFLGRNRAKSPWWWLAGLALGVLFALSHDRRGLALLPLVAMGLCSLWLIAATHRFWPSVGLHFLHNAFFTSLDFYQSIWAFE